MRILISPYPARLVTGKKSPKSFPWWPKLVQLLEREGYDVVQVGIKGEVQLVKTFVMGATYRELRELMTTCATFIAVDNFWQHFAHCEKLGRGVVLWGPSDPRLFGYPSNTNLLRGRDFLRPHQYQSWTDWEWNPNAFVYAENVIPHVVQLAPLL